MTTDENELFVRSLPMTHEIVVEKAKRYALPEGSALDLGAWGGALTQRLQEAGFRVTAADIENHLKVAAPFVSVDLNDANFDRAFSSSFDLVASVEVIEHIENPAALLKPKGIAIVTTPNVDNVAARVKFLVSGKVRAMDEMAPEHLTPIHLDLFLRQILPRTGLELVETFVHPEGDFPLTARRFFIPFFRLLAVFLKGPALTGDCLVFVLRKP